MSMDDDLYAVWGAPTDPRLLNLSTTPLSIPSPALSHDHIDDFDDFHTPPQTQNPSIAQDDDFADFGEFGEVGLSDVPFTFKEEEAFEPEEVQVAESSQLTWCTLQLDSLPSEEDLRQRVEEILGPAWAQSLPDLTVEGGIRQVEGMGQILVEPESRQLYHMLITSPPLVEPINWIRSRIRQQHLITLGLPVNLDDLLPPASTKPLPTLHMLTRPGSTPPVVPNEHLRNGLASQASSRPGTPRSNTPQQSLRTCILVVTQLGLGPKPQLNEKRVNALLALEPDELKFLPVSKLEQYLSELQSETTNASSLLSYLLQTRDALQQDSETYNQLIAELVSEAQRRKTGKRTGKRGGASG